MCILCVHYYSVVSVDPKHLLIQHRERVLIGLEEENYQRINVRRPFLLKDTLKQISKDSFNANKMLRVVFIGEQAVDEGGPRREFFNLILREAFSQCGLFAGYPANVLPLHNVQAVEKNNFIIWGKSYPRA